MFSFFLLLDRLILEFILKTHMLVCGLLMLLVEVISKYFFLFPSLLVPKDIVIACATRVISFCWVLQLIYSFEVKNALIEVEPSPIKVELHVVGLVESLLLSCMFLLRWSLFM